MPKNSKNTVSLLMIGSVILAIILIVLLVYNGIKNKEDDGIPDTVIDISTGQVVNEELLKVYNMEEAERIKYYFNTYIKYIDDKDYEKAYNMLDDKFKNNYFKTLNDYTKYIQKKYPVVMSITYNDITRFGNYYILDVSFLDVLGDIEEEENSSQKFVFYETNYNEYKMSFQAE